MPKNHLALLHAKHAEGEHIVNVNAVHQETLSFNDKIAARVSSIVGTMWFCYGLALLMFSWYALQERIFPALHIPAFDPYPFAFLFFCLGGIMQSLLMPLIMVSQNRNAVHTELRAESDHHINQENFQHIESIVRHLEKQDEELLKQTGMLIQLVSAKGKHP
jgi:uncharacterized membrane protein